MLASPLNIAFREHVKWTSFAAALNADSPLSESQLAAFREIRQSRSSLPPEVELTLLGIFVKTNSPQLAYEIGHSFALLRLSKENVEAFRLGMRQFLTDPDKLHMRNELIDERAGGSIKHYAALVMGKLPNLDLDDQKALAISMLDPANGAGMTSANVLIISPDLSVELVPLLRLGLCHPNSRIQTLSARVLNTLGPLAADAVDELRDVMVKSNGPLHQEGRLSACRTLCSLGTAAGSVVKELIDFVQEHPSTDVRKLVFVALANQLVPYVKPHIESLYDIQQAIMDEIDELGTYLTSDSSFNSLALSIAQETLPYLELAIRKAEEF